MTNRSTPFRRSIVHPMFFFRVSLQVLLGVKCLTTQPTFVGIVIVVVVGCHTFLQDHGMY